MTQKKPAAKRSAAKNRTTQKTAAKKTAAKRSTRKKQTKSRKLLYSLIVLAILFIQAATGNLDLSTLISPQDSAQESTASLPVSGEPSPAPSGTPAQQPPAQSGDLFPGSTAQSFGQPVSPETIPEYSGEPYIVLNNNVPFFTDEEMTTASFELYGDLDSLGRCTAAYANVGTDLMPTEKRGSISSVKPTGWHSVQYDNVDGKSLYNRCHLIGFQLTGENANKKNLITGTRYLNVDGMLPFEDMIADYVKETNNHVLYRVTPIFRQDNLVADGVEMEAWSVEDNGDGVCFHIFAYNVQPGIEIDYATGESRLIP